jgi:hypothetical protein
MTLHNGPPKINEQTDYEVMIGLPNQLKNSNAESYALAAAGVFEVLTPLCSNVYANLVLTSSQYCIRRDHPDRVVRGHPD